MDFLKNVDKKWLLAIAILVVIVVFSLSGSSNDNKSSDKTSSENSSVSVDDIYSYRSEDGGVTGKIKVTNTFNDGRTSFEFAFIINDDVPNNGFCQSNDAEYCTRESSQEIEDIKYRYGVTFASTEAADNLIATVYEPIYCNLGAAKADPFNIGFNKTDIKCDVWKVANWEPTNWFVARSQSSTDNFSELISDLSLNVYDIADDFMVEVENGGATITTDRLDYDQIPANEKIGNFQLNLVEN